ncbi:hypothetical protein KDU71_07470 [Carboxylicivirga sediminis]|uniref:Uncharacterized protein n=1 Tax=Carboxylicivirga sediminis TaxID=2006564 RepID=A0A941IWP5_9BACT|nr:hypothetical protein [Carboxylicivirga sediminis]MBR8535395.1 hypothetical protein [Carboxylicivirga sediminis]
MEGVAADFSKTITEEAQIETVLTDGVISSLKFSAQFAQTEGDRRVNDGLKAWREKHNLDENGKPIESPTPPKPGDDKNVPDWAKGLIEKVDQMATTQESITKSQKSAQALETVKAQLKEKGVPDKFLDTYAKQVDLEAEDLNASVEAAYNSYDTLQKGIKAELIESGDYKPSGGSATEETTTESIKTWSPS